MALEDCGRPAVTLLTRRGIIGNIYFFFFHLKHKLEGHARSGMQLAGLVEECFGRTWESQRGLFDDRCSSLYFLLEKM